MGMDLPPWDPPAWMASIVPGVPDSVFWAIVVLVVGILLVRFVLKSAFTLVKIAILVAIAVGVYLVYQNYIEPNL